MKNIKFICAFLVLAVLLANCKKSDIVTDEKQKKTRVNGYINFCKKMRDNIKNNNPDFTGKDITKELNKKKRLYDEEMANAGKS